MRVWQATRGWCAERSCSLWGFTTRRGRSSRVCGSTTPAAPGRPPARCLVFSPPAPPGPPPAPRYFNLIRFGPYFGDLILPEAAAAGLDPLFLLSVVRQESLFQGAATSSASARGLMQVIPSTGAAITH